MFRRAVLFDLLTCTHTHIYHIFEQITCVHTNITIEFDTTVEFIVSILNYELNVIEMRVNLTFQT